MKATSEVTSVDFRFVGGASITDQTRGLETQIPKSYRHVTTSCSSCSVTPPPPPTPPPPTTTHRTLGAMLATLGELTELWVVFNGNRGSIILIHRDNKPCVSGAVKGGGEAQNRQLNCRLRSCLLCRPQPSPVGGERQQVATGHTLLRSLLGDDYQMLVSSLVRQRQRCPWLEP